MGVVAKCHGLGISIPDLYSTFAPQGGVCVAYCRGASVKLTASAGPARQVATFRWPRQIVSGNRRRSTQGVTMDRITITEGESAVLLARPTNSDGTYVLAADVSSALLNVFDTTRTARSSPVYTDELVVADVMQATQPIVDAEWTEDNTGRTFRYVLPAGVLIEGGRRYRIELVLRTTTSGPRSTYWAVDTLPLLTSRAHLGV